MSDQPATCCGIDPTETVELPAFALAALACDRGRSCAGGERGPDGYGAGCC